MLYFNNQDKRNLSYVDGKPKEGFQEKVKFNKTGVDDIFGESILKRLVDGKEQTTIMQDGVPLLGLDINTVDDLMQGKIREIMQHKGYTERQVYIKSLELMSDHVQHSKRVIGKLSELLSLMREKQSEEDKENKESQLDPNEVDSLSLKNSYGYINSPGS